MDNTRHDLESVLLDAFTENRIDPSKDWVNLSLKELNKQLEKFKQKRVQSSSSEEDRRRKALIIDGLYINALLTLVHGKYFLEKGKYLEYRAYGARTIDKGDSATSSQFTSSIDSCAKSSHPRNIDQLSAWQEAHLIHLTTDFPTWLKVKKNIENGSMLPPDEYVMLSFSPLSVWQCRHIKWQAAAQVLWCDTDANAKEISKKLLSSEAWVDLLDLWILPNIDKYPKEDEVEFRNLEKVIRQVNPRGVKKGRPSKNKIIAQNPVFIPFVYNVTSKTVNLEALRIAIDVMVKLMKIKGRSLQEIVNDPLIFQYKSLTSRSRHFLFKDIVDVWIPPAFEN